MKKMEAQPISADDLAKISALHQQRLGWSYLLQETIADRTVGFPCEQEEFAIRRQLRTTVQRVSEWFRIMGQQNDWPSKEGWMWEVDFESSQVVPKKQRRPGDGTAVGQKGAEDRPLAEGPIMDLGDMDVDIIKRLLERRNTLADSARSRLRVLLGGESTAIDELDRTVQQLGAADKDVRDWFTQMAETYKWPRVEDTGLMYRVDIQEKQVLISRVGTCPTCS